MKRKHIYLGGTVLLVLLGALGGYFLLAGGSEGGGRPQTSTAEQASDATEAVPIDVPPIEEEAFTVPSVPAGDETPPRYAMGGSRLDAGNTYPPPEAGGASPLPASPLPAGDPSGSHLPAGGPFEGTLPHGAAGPAYEQSESGTKQDMGVVTRGQEPSAVEAATSHSANPLRADARAAFSDSGDVPAADDATSRYQAAIEADAVAAPDAMARYVGDHDGSPAAPAELPEGTPQQGPVAETYEQDSGYADDEFNLPREASAPAPIAIADDRGASPLRGATPPPGPPGQDGYATYGDYDNPSAETGPAQGDFGAVEQDEEASASSPPRDLYGDETAATPIEDVQPLTASDDYGSAADYAADGNAFSREMDRAAAASTLGGEGTGRPGEPALEGPQSPQISVEKTAPAEIQVGKNCKFQIVVRNTGHVAAHDVRLVDEVPLGTQLVGASPRANVVGSQLEWELGTLAAGDERSVEVELLPTHEGEIGSVATVQFAAAASVRTICTRPQLELRTEVAPSVMIGQQQVVRITLRNPGSGDATGVMLLENVPEGVSHPHGRALEFEVGTLRAGESRELELVLTAEQKGVVQNQIIARGDGNLVAEDVTEFEVVAPEIAVSVLGPQRKYLQLPATFTVSIENPGTAAAKDVELVGKLPEGLEFVSADNYGQYDEATRSVYWSLAELPPRDRGEVKLVALPVVLGEQRLQVEASADLGLADQAESAVQVDGLAAIKFDVTDIADPVEVGGQTSYEIRIVNQGTKAATNVRVVAQFPEGIRPVRAEGPTSDAPQIEQGQVVFAPLKQLSTKADTTYRIEAEGLQPGDQRVLVRVMTDDLEQPINEEESTRVYADR